MRIIPYSIFSLLILLGTTHCKQNYVDPEETSQVTEKIQAVAVQKLELTTTAIPIVASGVVGSKAETNLSFKIGGIVERLYTDEGKRVRAGQLLAQIRTTEIDAQVLKAKQVVEKSTRDLERIEKLFRDSAATREQVQNLTTALEVAQADLEIATFNQQYAQIKAPHGGRILRKMAETNELVNPGTPIFRLASNKGKGFIVKVGIADKDIVRLRLNDKADVSFDAYPNESFSAYVSEIAEEADPRTGTFLVEVTLSASQKMIKNGFVAKLKLHPSQQDPYYKINMDALVEGYRNQAFLFIPDETGEKAKRISVVPAYIGAGYFTVLEEQLKAYDYVITEGAAYLEEGMEIRILDEEVSAVDRSISLKGME